MKTFRTVLLSLLFCIMIFWSNTDCSAQIKVNDGGKKKSTPPAEQKKANSNDPAVGKLTVKFTTDKNCKLKVDGEDKGNIEVDVIKKIYLPKGEYLISVEGYNKDFNLIKGSEV